MYIFPISSANMEMFESILFQLLSNKDNKFIVFGKLMQKHCTENKEEIKDGYLCDYVLEKRVGGVDVNKFNRKKVTMSV